MKSSRIWATWRRWWPRWPAAISALSGAQHSRPACGAGARAADSRISGGERRGAGCGRARLLDRGLGPFGVCVRGRRGRRAPHRRGHAGGFTKAAGLASDLFAGKSAARAPISCSVRLHADRGPYEERDGHLSGNTLRIGTDVVFRQLDDEAVLLNLKTGIYFGLNDVGARVWQLIADKRVLSECSTPSSRSTPPLRGARARPARAEPAVVHEGLVEVA